MTSVMEADSTTEYRWMQISPIDAWFFRDGKPFNRGQDHSNSRSLFPPPCGTVVGAIRYNLALSNGWNGTGSWCTEGKTNGQRSCEVLRAVLGDGPDLGQLSFSGPIVTHDDVPLFVMPRHVIGLTDVGERLLESTFHPKGFLEPSESFRSDLQHECLPIPSPSSMSKSEGAEKWPDSASEQFVTLAGMKQIIQGQLPDAAECVAYEQIFQIEARVGIGRDLHRRSVNEGDLYNPQFVRLADRVSLAVGISGIPEDWNVPSLVAFGGEARMAGLDECDPLSFRIEDGRPMASNRYMLISLTPSLFAIDDHATDDDPKDDSAFSWLGPRPGQDAGLLGEQSSNSLDGKIKTVAVDRAQRIGGWDGVSHCPIDKQSYVPAGTVWWIDSASNVPTPGSIVRIGAQASQGLGYGLAVCAGWSN